jgi:FkbM family methyltransferase
VAIEASPRVFPRLVDNVRSNGATTCIRCIHGAATRESGALSFDVGPESQTGWGGLTTASSAYRVDAFRLDERLADEERIALLKIDVEGADAWVLAGAEGLLRRGLVREVWFEENLPRMAALGIAPGTGAAFLRDCGYDAVQVGGGSGSLRDWRAVPRR